MGKPALKQLAVLQIGALHDDLVVQTHLVIGANLAVIGDKDIVFILVQRGDLQKALQVAVLDIDAALAAHDVKRRFINADALVSLEVDLCGLDAEA